jgi:hypothetical protein
MQIRIKKSKCNEIIEKLADAPTFCHTASPQAGSGLGSKPSKHYYDFKYDHRHNTGVSKS